LGEGWGGSSSTQAAGGVVMEAGGTTGDFGGAPSPSWLIAYQGSDTVTKFVSVAGLAVATNGELLVAGGFIGRVDLDPSEGTDFREFAYAEAPAGSQIGGLFVTRLDPTNRPVWTRTYNGAGFSEG